MSTDKVLNLPCTPSSGTLAGGAPCDFPESFLWNAFDFDVPYVVDVNFKPTSTSRLRISIEADIPASDVITLEPGDVIATGTPPGVGFARKPPVYLQPGDEMEVEIEGLGILRNTISE